MRLQYAPDRLWQVSWYSPSGEVCNGIYLTSKAYKAALNNLHRDGLYIIRKRRTAPIKWEEFDNGTDSA